MFLFANASSHRTYSSYTWGGFKLPALETWGSHLGERSYREHRALLPAGRNLNKSVQWFACASETWLHLRIICSLSGYFNSAFYLVLEYCRLTLLCQFQVNSERLSHTRVHSPPNSPPVQAAPLTVTLSRVPCAIYTVGSLLGISLKYSSVYMSIQNSLTSPSPHLSLWLVIFFKKANSLGT